MIDGLISVLLPVYNSEKYIERAVYSILNQSYSNVELIVCDDGSSDKSYSIVKSLAKKDKRIRLFKNKGNLGKVATINLYKKYCLGEYITIHDSDDYSDEKRFEYLLNEFKKDNELNMVGSYCHIVSEKGKRLRIDERETDYFLILERLVINSQFNGATVLMKKKAWDEAGGYRKYFNNYAYEDYDLTARIALAYKAINIALPLYFYRQHSHSFSKRITLNNIVGKRLVQVLIEDRIAKGNDFLDRKEFDKLEGYIDDLKKTYLQDPSLLYREYASYFMYGGFYYKAIKASYKALIENPFKLVNWGTFQYCLRKSLLSI